MKRNKINTMKQNSRREQVKANRNEWIDTGNEHADIKTPQKTLTPRNRKPPRKKNVTCHKCGKTQQVNANLVYGEFYRCDRCVG
jgi:RNase P subunit RPR2